MVYGLRVRASHDRAGLLEAPVPPRSGALPPVRQGHLQRCHFRVCGADRCAEPRTTSTHSRSALVAERVTAAQDSSDVVLNVRHLRGSWPTRSVVGAESPSCEGKRASARACCSSTRPAEGEPTPGVRK